MMWIHPEESRGGIAEEAMPGVKRWEGEEMVG